MGVGEIADELGVHSNTVRFHLDALVADGRVEQARRSRRRPGRPPLMFQAIRQMDPGGMRHYRMLAEILVNRLAAEPDPGVKAMAAGREWGRRLESPRTGVNGIGADDAIEQLVNLLDELGFAPERQESGGQVRVGLRHCPFLELAEARTSVICPIHLGIMQGALEHWGAPVTVEGLDAFVEPDMCQARVVQREASE